MDTKQLKTLAAIADQGTFAKAARRVNLTPSAVSQQMQALERELGVALFDRSSRPPSLNAKGLQFLETAHSILQIVDDSTTSISGGSVTGTLNIGSIRTSTIEILPRAIVHLRRSFPKLTFKLQVGLSEALMNDVVSGRLDLAIVAENVGVAPILKWTPFLREPLVVIAPPGATQTEAEAMIMAHPFVRYRTAVPLASQIDTEMSRLGLQPEVIAEVDTVPATIECVKAGLGVAIVPHVATLAAGARSLPRAPFGSPTVFRQLGIVQRIGSPRAGLIAAMHDRLAAFAHPFGVPATGRERVEGGG
ncbi:MAG: LysR family transcriptional regulator [Kiloniellaceae bacterium]